MEPDYEDAVRCCNKQDRNEVVAQIDLVRKRWQNVTFAQEFIFSFEEGGFVHLLSKTH